MAPELLPWFESAAAPSVRRAAEAVDGAQRGLLVAGGFSWDSPMAAQAYRSALAEVHGGLFAAQTRLDAALAAAIQHDHAVVAVRAARQRAFGAVLAGGFGGVLASAFGGALPGSFVAARPGSSGGDFGAGFCAGFATGLGGSG